MIEKVLEKSRSQGFSDREREAVIYEVLSYNERILQEQQYATDGIWGFYTHDSVVFLPLIEIK